MRISDWSSDVCSSDLIDGEVVAGEGRERPPEARSVGLVFQDYALFPHLSITDNVAFGLRRLPGAERRQRVADALDLVGMAASGGVYPHMLRSEEHTSELQSLMRISYAVFCLKKKKQTKKHKTSKTNNRSHLVNVNDKP